MCMLITDRIKESYHPPMPWAEQTATATLVLGVLTIIVSIWAAIKSERTQKKLDKLQAEREEARRKAARIESRTSRRGNVPVRITPCACHNVEDGVVSPVITAGPSVPTPEQRPTGLRELV